jgi:AraC-like DNA-binding protein
MKILALLQSDARQVVERALTGDQHLAKAAGAESVIATLRENRCEAFVFDPGMLGAADFEAVIGAVNRSGVPVLIYTELEPLTARRIVEVVEFAARELVLRGSDDAPELLHRKLAALVVPSAPAILLSKVAPHFRSFPEPLQTVVVGLFGRSPLPRWVNSLADETGLARRTVDRWMDKVGIFGAARLLDVVRFAGVWEPLVEQQLSVEDVFARCGYARQRLFMAHSRRLVGVSPLEIRKRYTRETFSARLADVLLD